MMCAVAVAMPDRARAQPRGCSAAPTTGQARLELHFEPPPAAARLELPVLRALRGTLAEGLIICGHAAQRTEDTDATIRVSSSGPEHAIFSIHIVDRVTEKQVTRQLPLADFPVDSRPLAIAVAIDELLRATWLELSLKQAQLQRGRAVEAVQQTVAQDLQEAAMQQGLLHDGTGAPMAFAARAAVEYFPAGELLMGSDVGILGSLPGPLTLALFAGARRGMFHRGALGRVRITAAALHLGVELGIWQSDWVDLFGDAAIDGLVAFAGAVANSNGVANNDVAFASSALIGVGTKLHLAGFLALRAGARIGVSMLPVIVSDSSGDLIDTRGLHMQATVGLELSP